MTVSVPALPNAAIGSGRLGSATPAGNAASEAMPDGFDALVAAFFALDAQLTGQTAMATPASKTDAQDAQVMPITDPGAPEPQAQPTQQNASAKVPPLPVQASNGTTPTTPTTPVAPLSSAVSVAPAEDAGDAMPPSAEQDNSAPVSGSGSAGLKVESDTAAPFAADSGAPASESAPSASAGAQKTPPPHKGATGEKSDNDRRSPQISGADAALTLPTVLVAQVLTPVPGDTVMTAANGSGLGAAIKDTLGADAPKNPAGNPPQPLQPGRPVQPAPQPPAADPAKPASQPPLQVTGAAQPASSDAANTTPVLTIANDFARAMAALAPPPLRLPANGLPQQARDRAVSVQQVPAAKVSQDQTESKISGAAPPQSANQKSNASPPGDQDSHAAPNDPPASQQPAVHVTSAHTASPDSDPPQPALAPPASPSSAAQAIFHTAAADSGPPAPAAQAAPDIPVRLANVPGGTDTDLTQLALHVAAKSADGDSHFLVRLDPPELGRVEVNLDVDSQGNAHASLSADQPSTLDLLQRDAPALERALRDAGLALAGGLSFSLKGGGGSGNGRTPENNGRARTLRIEAAAPGRNAPVLSANLFHRNWGAAHARLDITV